MVFQYKAIDVALMACLMMAGLHVLLIWLYVQIMERWFIPGDIKVMQVARHFRLLWKVSDAPARIRACLLLGPLVLHCLLALRQLVTFMTLL